MKILPLRRGWRIALPMWHSAETGGTNRIATRSRGVDRQASGDPGGAGGSWGLAGPHVRRLLGPLLLPHRRIVEPGDLSDSVMGSCAGDSKGPLRSSRACHRHPRRPREPPPALCSWAHRCVLDQGTRELDRRVGRTGLLPLVRACRDGGREGPHARSAARRNRGPSRIGDVVGCGREGSVPRHRDLQRPRPARGPDGVVRPSGFSGRDRGGARSPRRSGRPTPRGFRGGLGPETSTSPSPRCRAARRSAFACLGMRYRARSKVWPRGRRRNVKASPWWVGNSSARKSIAGVSSENRAPCGTPSRVRSKPAIRFSSERKTWARRGPVTRRPSRSWPSTR